MILFLWFSNTVTNYDVRIQNLRIQFAVKLEVIMLASLAKTTIDYRCKCIHYRFSWLIWESRCNLRFLFHPLCIVNSSTWYENLCLLLLSLAFIFKRGEIKKVLKDVACLFFPVIFVIRASKNRFWLPQKKSWNDERKWNFLSYHHPAAAALKSI